MLMVKITASVATALMAALLMFAPPGLAQDQSHADRNRLEQAARQQQETEAHFRREAEAQRARDQQAANDQYRRDADARPASADATYAGGGFVTDNSGTPSTHTVLWVSAAWHADADDVFVATQQPSQQAADAAAVRTCTNVMRREGCAIAANAGSGAISIVRNSDGFFHAGWGASRQNAEQAASSACAAVAPPCEVFRTFGSDDSFSIPGQPENHYVPAERAELFKRYGVIVNADGGDSSGTLWAATGFPSHQDAEKAGRAACEQATQTKCVARMNGTDGVIGAYLDGQGRSNSTRGRNEAGMRQFVRQHCADNRLGNCRVTDVFDVREPGVVAFRGDD